MLSLTSRLESETDRAIFHESLLPRAGKAMPAQIERYRRVMAGWKPSATASVAAAGASESPVLFPSAYGADPTGKQDSTAAFQDLMQDLLSRNAGVSPWLGFARAGAKLTAAAAPSAAPPDAR